MIEKHLPRERGTVVLHWFTGSRSDARRAVSLGCYFSVNAEMTRSERGRALIAELPSDRILTETDGPFTQVDGRPAEPQDTHGAVEAVAKIRESSAEAMGTTVVANLQSLLRR
jgi:TatD DNase family protein